MAISRHFALLALTSTLVLSQLGCSKVETSDIKTQAAFNANIDRTKVKTYAWAGGVGAVRDPDGLWTPPNFNIVTETKFQIDTQLRNHGLTESTESPDVAVAFLFVNDVKELEQIKEKTAGEVAELPGVGKGALVIELVDLRSGHTFFLGTATAETKPSNGEAAAKERLAYAVAKIFDNYQ